MTSFIDEYHILYENAKIWEKNTWFNIPCWKLPFDQVVIQELIVKTKPEFIIETGTAYGGSAAFYASICELLGEGKIITIDIENKISNEIGKYVWSNRIDFIHGSSINEIVLDNVKKIINKQNPKCMVILDSWHSMEHVYQEMNIYKEFIPIGSYMIVEDSHANGNPVPWKYNDKGPMGAIDKFLEENKDEWEIDWSCEKHLMSFNPKGYLRRIK